MADHRRENPSPDGPQRYALRVFRVADGQSITFRGLADAYSGLLVHWIRGRSVYCPGADECPPNRHREGIFWKGYLAGEFWVPERAQWYPTILELTEAVELDLRGRYQKGQQWQVSKGQSGRGKKEPVTARFLVGHAGAPLPPAPPVLDVLRQLYHVHDIRLGIANPMPGRVIVAPRQDEGPANTPADDYLSPAEQREVIKRLMDDKRARNGKGDHQ